MHKTGWYLDFRIVFTPSFEHHEIPNLVYNLDQVRKKFGAVVSWVLKKSRTLYLRLLRMELSTERLPELFFGLEWKFRSLRRQQLTILRTIVINIKRRYAQSTFPTCTPAAVRKIIVEEVMDYRTFCCAIAKPSAKT